MLKHPFRKALGLTVLYAVIIIGIFVLQFRNESVLFKNTGLLRISVAETLDSNGNKTIKNNLQVSFKGINFTVDNLTPLQLISSNRQPVPLSLVSWEQPTEQSYRFNFTENTSLTFAVSDTTEDASLSVTAKFPASADFLSLPYKPVSGFSVTEQTKTNQFVSSKKSSYRMSAQEITGNEILFTNKSNTLSYNNFVPSDEFTLASIPADSVNAREHTLAEHIKAFRENLVETAEAAFHAAETVPERAVAAYVAELSCRGKFKQAVDNVPESFKKGSRRTYFTAPYFNSLVSMNSTLTMTTENLSSLVENAVATKNYSIFDAQNIENFILQNQSSKNVLDLLSLPASEEEFDPTLTQASGILNVYVFLQKNGVAAAQRLLPAVGSCIQKITASCHLAQDTLTLSNSDIPADIIQSAKIGANLIEYAKLVSDESMKKCGTMILNTLFAKNQHFDLRTAGELYPILVKDAKNYPHTDVLRTTPEKTIWAWTCASDIVYENSADKNVTTLKIDFSKTDSHYVIIKGIEPFERIEIYGLSFHTDERFETYNSSGYVYNRATQTLFLKSRHRSPTEVIRLYRTFEKETPKAGTQEQSVPAAEETEPQPN